MSEEEKEAIAFLRRDIKFRKNNKWFENCIIEPKIAQILLNLIDKLQKEIERIKSIDIHKLVEDAETGQLIHKDKIRTKIKELEEKDKMFKLELPEDVTIYQYGIEVLKELLNE